MFGKKKDKKEKKKGRRFFSLDSHATMDMDLRSNWSVFKALCGFVLSAEKTPLLDISVAKRAWGIEGWTSEEVERWRVRRQFWGMVAMGFMLALMFLAGYNWWNNSFGLISGIGYTFALLATASLSTVYLWQSDMIGGTEFVPYVEYVSRFKWLLMLIAVLGWASMDQTALMAAQAIDLPDTEITRTGDLSAKFVGSIIGAPWETYAQDGMVFYGMYSVLLPILAALNTGALAFVSIFAVYIHTLGAVNIAHTGNWNDTSMFNVFWSPIRTVVALALCSPLTNGVSLLHHIILVAVAMSINLANNVSDVFMDYLNKHNLQLSAVRTYQANQNFSELWANMFPAVTLQVARKNLGGDDSITEKNGFECKVEEYNKSEITNEKNRNILGEDRAGGMFNVGEMLKKIDYTLICAIKRPKGEIGSDIIISSTFSNEADKDVVEGALYEMYYNIYDMSEGYITKDVEERRKNQEELKDLILNTFNTFNNTIKRASFSKTDATKSASSKELLRQMTELTEQYGWMTVGMYPFVIAKAQSDLQEKVNVAFSYKNNNTEFRWDEYATVDEISEKNDLHQYLVSVEAITGKFSKENNVFGMAEQFEDQSFLMYKLANLAGANPRSIADMFISSNAVAALNQEGSNIIKMGAIALSTFGLVKGVADGTGKITDMKFGPIIDTFLGGLGGIIKVWSPLIIFACGVIMAFGFSCAYILPALPIIFWARALVSWAIMLVQTMMGAPFWAAAHIFPEGAGLAGQHARQGYLMLLDVFIRPTLLVCGAIMCMLLLEAWTQILGQILLLWADLTIKSAEYSCLGVLITAGVTMFVLYTTIKYLFVEALGGFPQQVMKWCGSHTMAEDGRNDAAASVNVLTSKTGQGLSGMAMGLSAPKSDNRNNRSGGGNVGDRSTKS